MKSKFVIWILLVFVSAFVLLSGEAILQQKALAEKTLRLHIVANSDSAADQALKLRLRDHVLQEVNALTYSCRSLRETESILLDNLTALEGSAQGFLQGEGSSYDVRITLCEEDFSTREYDTFSLPAGEYHSLRIVIGNGEGKNWWCVVFPTLCNASSTKDLEAAATFGGYGEDDLALIRKEEPKYVIQFKILEILKGVFR